MERDRDRMMDEAPEHIGVFTYKEPKTLKPFLSENGKINPGRSNRVTRKEQSFISQEIKRARHLALLPIADKHIYLRERA